MTSAAVNPAERRRSKPRGAGVVVCEICEGREDTEGICDSGAEAFSVESFIVEAWLASVARSDSESAMSPMEQWM